MMAEVASLDLANKFLKNKKTKTTTMYPGELEGEGLLSQLAGEVSDAVLHMPTTLSFSHPWTLHQAQEPPPAAGLQ